MKINNNEFKTYDLNLTACMVALGHPIEKIHKQGGNRCQFCFKRSDKLKTDVLAYWKQAVVVNPHALFDALKFIKSRIYAGDID
jgi:formylmethanofuran:tetrahydromethanopterin formyltransferase|tara:strand:+ start:496 stop:747 length:252 start_codon:yes stop_codon:yes gene_type:complete